MILYGLYSGGVARCCGTTRAGHPCRNRGYTTSLQRGFWCHLHREQEPASPGLDSSV